MQKQKGLINATLVVEAGDLPAVEQFVDHLTKKPHITITKRSDMAFTTDEGDQYSVHLSVERRACWGNWASDIQRDVAHSLRRCGSTASCSIIEVRRTVVERRSD